VTLGTPDVCPAALLPHPDSTMLAGRQIVAKTGDDDEPEAGASC
jgi:hypothetical protein